MAKKVLKKRGARNATSRPGHLVKRDSSLPALGGSGDRVFIRGGTTFGVVSFKRDTVISPPAGGYQAGTDYGVFVTRGKASAKALVAAPKRSLPSSLLGGFHYALGGNARAENGGDSTPQVNPRSFWDRNFLPGCPDPRGMALVTDAHGQKFWCDIYLLGADHLDNGTSRAGVKIADGSAPPQDPSGGRFKKLDYVTAQAVMAHHCKQLLSPEEFFAAAYGVTEKSAHSGDPDKTGLDAARTSRDGIMQATGNMWVWGHCGHPTQPRASIFGGSWVNGGYAGSRFASVAYRWPERSYDGLGARGRSDHLQLA